MHSAMLQHPTLTERTHSGVELAVDQVAITPNDYRMCLLLLPQSTKMSGSTDLNLLHYIVAHVSAVLPGALAVDGERQAFRAACRRGTFDAGEGANACCCKIKGSTFGSTCVC
jgi:hypothetical protein